MAEESARKVINDLWCKYFNSFHRVDDSTKSVEGECTNFLEWYSSRTDLLLKEFRSLADTLRLMLFIDEENQFVVGGLINSEEHMAEEEKSYISNKHFSIAEENSDADADAEEESEEDDESESYCSESDSEEHGGELEEHYYEPLNEILYKILPMTGVFGDEEDKEVYRSMLDAYFRECLKNEWI